MYNQLGQNTSTQGQTTTKAYADKVDLNDLDMEDWERVMRLFFSKINQGTNPAANW